MNIHEATEQAYKNGYEQGKRDALKWIPVTERMPENGVHVLAAVKLDGLFCSEIYVCDAYYTEQFFERVDDHCGEFYDISCDYFEYEDEYYLEEGWYEVVNNWDDFDSVRIADTVTHWMPLPAPPKEGE